MLPDGACDIISFSPSLPFSHPLSLSLSRSFFLSLSHTNTLFLSDGGRSGDSEKAIRWIISCDQDSRLKFTMPCLLFPIRRPGFCTRWAAGGIATSQLRADHQCVKCQCKYACVMERVQILGWRQGYGVWGLRCRAEQQT